MDMIDTQEYYGGTYPKPCEEIDDVEYKDDYDLHMADEYHELMMIGEIE